MISPNPLVDPYFADGCGRCKLVGTPECKVHNWREELQKLRAIMLASGLKEERKWGVPCYTFQNSNIALISAFKASCALSFFKGALLDDPKGILVMPGENSQATRYICFTSMQDIIRLEPVLDNYIQGAIELENAGRKVTFKKTHEPIPDELQEKLDTCRDFKAAFEALTPGRQRGYILHFSQPKQAKTRESRIKKCTPAILAGKGLHDR